MQSPTVIRTVISIPLEICNQLVQVKTQVATAIAESHKLQHRSKEKAAEAESWLKKAEQLLNKTTILPHERILDTTMIRSNRCNATSSSKKSRNTW